MASAHLRLPRPFQKLGAKNSSINMRLAFLCFGFVRIKHQIKQRASASAHAHSRFRMHLFIQTIAQKLAQTLPRTNTRLILSITQQPAHSLTHPPTHPPTNSPTYPPTNPSTHSPFNSICKPPAHTCKHAAHTCKYDTRPPVASLTHPITCTPTSTPNHFLIYPLTGSCVCSLMQSIATSHGSRPLGCCRQGSSDCWSLCARLTWPGVPSRTGRWKPSLSSSRPAHCETTSWMGSTG